jgi:hypothetical protein
MAIYLDELDLPAAAAAVVASSTILANNQRIQVKINLVGSTLFTIKASDGDALSQASTKVFYTVASPMYSSVDTVLLCGGDVLEQLPEVAVWQMIYAASTWVDDSLLFDPDVKFPDQSNSNQNWKFFQRARMEFTKCKAIRDILRAALASRGMNAGRRTLADFTIDLSSQANLISQARSFAGEMNDECRYWMDAMFSGGAADFQNPRPTSAVKSGNNPNESGGIGRGWVVGGPTLNRREPSTISNGTKNRPRRYSGRGKF